MLLIGGILTKQNKCYMYSGDDIHMYVFEGAELRAFEKS